MFIATWFVIVKSSNNPDVHSQSMVKRTVVSPYHVIVSGHTTIDIYYSLEGKLWPTCCCCYVTLVVSDSVRPHRRQPTRLPVPGILQARTLEWVAISFSNAWKWKVKVKSLSLATPWTAAYQAPPSMGFSRQKYWSGVPLPSLLTNLDSILKSRDITWPTKVRLVKAMAFPVVMYGCESWTMKKAERRRIDALELWCWRRLLSILEATDKV